jgi:subtilisin family serine protease
MSRHPSPRRFLPVLLAVAPLLPGSAPAQAPVLPPTGQITAVSGVLGGDPPAPSPLDINALVGATTFYGNGYTGTRAVVANIEGGHIWSDHESLTHVTTHIDAGPPVITSEVDGHATFVGSLIGGRPVPGDTELAQAAQRGIAFGATLWSGAVATSFSSDGSFNASILSLTVPYQTAFADGVNGRTADVINSSWGFDETTGSEFVGVTLDGLAHMYPQTTFVVSAGNAGPSPNTVGNPGSAYNNITVGALSATGTYTTPSGFSSRGPSTYSDPVNGVLPTPVRASVDIAAPGSAIYGAFYGGTTGQNSGGTDPTGGATDQYIQSAGTSFSAPIVAGAAALVVDAAYANFPADLSSRDSRVVKAVLMNSADKTVGWDNGQTLSGGVITTTQSLDYNVGAGALNLDSAYHQLLSGTPGIPGTGGGNVLHTGWDLGVVSEGLPTDYSITSLLEGGSLFNATLTWNRERYYLFDSQGGVAYDISQADLDLQVWSTDDGVPTDLIAASSSEYNNVEHLSFFLPDTDTYLLRVLWAGELFDLLDSDNLAEFGLAWSGSPVPEPATLATGALVLLVAVASAHRSRHSRNTGSK